MPWSSVRAGFSGRELSALWRREGGWVVEERAPRALQPRASWRGAMAERFDALIVGAGPAGSTAAILLASRGLARRSSREGDLSAAQGLRRVHLRRGLAAPRRARRRRARRGDRGPEVRRVGLFADDRLLDAPMPAAATFRGGRALGREHLDALLVARARGMRRRGFARVSPANRWRMRRHRS
jgi:hypothetical protein